jgi:probable F420-dependent oxidoreductase
MSSMNFSMWLWPYARWGGVDDLARAGKRIEELGFASISVSDHTLIPTSHTGELGTSWPDWAVVSALIAARTTQLRIVTSLVVPYRHPIAAARQIATLDQISNGRLTVAAAIGWLAREFEMLNVDFSKRGRITDEYLAAMIALWTEDAPTFSGDFVAFSDVVFEPRCVQEPRVPILIAGGDSPKSIDRLLRIGDGWMPMGDDDPERLAGIVSRIRSTAEDQGRDPETLTFRYTIGIGEAEVSLADLSKRISDETSGIVSSADPSSTPTFEGSAEEVAESVARYQAAGFTELAINPAGRSYGECMERIEWFATEVMPLVS